MKYRIIDKQDNVLFETDKKEEVDFFIDDNLEGEEFLGFYWENDRMVISLDDYDILVIGI